MSEESKIFIQPYELEYVIRNGKGDKKYVSKKKFDGTNKVYVRNVRVRGNLEIPDGYPNLIYVFENCWFGALELSKNTFRSFIFSNCIIPSFLIGGTSEINLLQFENCVSDGIYIKGRSKIGTLVLRGKNKINNWFSISQEALISEVDIMGGKFDRISFYEHPTIGSVSMYNVIVEKNTEITGGTYKGNFSVVGGEYQKSLVFNGGQFEKEVSIEGVRIHENLNIHNGRFENDISVNDSQIKGSLGLFKWSGNVFLRKLLAKKIYFTNVQGGHISLFEPLVHDIHFHNFHNSGELKLTNIRGWNNSDVIFDDLHNSKDHIFYKKEKVSPVITIDNSSLGKTEIIGCNLKEGKLTLDNSKILEIFYTDTIFPEKIESNESLQNEQIQQISDTYAQLKSVADKQNDKESSLRFHAKQNEQLLLLKRLSSKWWKFGSKIRWERLQLWMSKTSNDFGTNYVKSLAYLISFSFVIFGLYYADVNENIYWTLNFTEWPTGDFLQFLNPVRKRDYLCPQNGCSQWASSLDAISRIVQAYLVYQLIQAFRKYGK